MNLNISDGTLRKLKEKHHVVRREVEQCFENREGKLLRDTRLDHQTDPPTLWFIAQTNRGRLLKIVYIQRGPSVDLKSAFEPNDVELRIYARHGAPG